MNTTLSPQPAGAPGAGAEPPAATEATSLTKREIEVLIQSASGDKTRTIADRMFLSKRTIDFHRANIFKKLGVNSILAAIQAAVANGHVEVRRVLS